MNDQISLKKQQVEPLFEKKTTVRRLSITVAAGVILGLLAPFGMHQLSVLISVSYWVTTCVLGYFVYAPILYVTHTMLLKKVTTQWYRVAIGAFIGSAVMSLFIPVTVWMFFDIDLDFYSQLVSAFPKTLLIGGVITSIGFAREQVDRHKTELQASNQALEASLEQNQQSAHKAAEDAVESAYQTFMQDIPLEKRGKLLCLEMDDHYVKVYTDKGHHMLLKRFKDAVQSLEAYPGLQTHRSWWVAKDAVVSVNKEQRKVQLVLSNDLTVPVSRTYLEQVKQAGFNA